MELLVEWRARAGEPGVPRPTDAAVRRVAGNAITAGTATFIGSDLLVERPKLWAAAARLNPSWAVTGACPRVAGDDRFGAAAPALPVDTRDLGMWRGGGGERAAPAPSPRVNVRGGLSLVVGWLWSLAMLVAVPGYSGALESFLAHESFGILETRFGMSFDPHALRHTAAGGTWPAGVPPPRATVSRKQLWTSSCVGSLPRIVDYLSLDGLALKTSKKYESAMAQWVAFTTNLNRDGQEQFPVFMTGENPARDERHLFEFVAYQGWLMGNKPSTIHGKLTGIRWHHLNNGLKNPCDDKFRLEAIIKSLKQIRGESTGKGPVTPDQLRHLKAKMNFRNPRHVVAWAAVAQGFFLCMRTSEYLAEGYTFDATRSPTTDKIMPHCNAIPRESCDFDLADLLTVIFELSKTDQNRVGCSRSVFATGDDLCPVEAYKALRRLRINNWKPGEAAMGDGSGWVMNRDVMTSVLKATAIATLV
jgi:hypothetical protein